METNQKPLRVNFGKNAKIVSGLAGVVLISGLLVGMAGKKGESVAGKTEEIALVKTLTVNSEEAGQIYSYSGVVRGRHESQLAFQVSGKLVGKNVILGSIVHQGDVLMQVDPVDLRRTNESVEAQVSAAESQYQLAKDNLARYETLYRKGLISDSEYDRIKSGYDNAAAMLKQAKAQNANSKNMLNYCNLTASCSGVVTGVFAETGQVVSAGQPVVTVVRDSEKEVEINIPENRLAEVRNARQLKVKFWALPDIIVPGNIREVSPIADPISRTYLMRVSLLNPPADIQLGMTAEVVAANQNAETVAIPLAAIYQTGDTPAVWVVNEGRVKLRTITVGEFGDEQVHVVKGLQNGDVIVIAGVHKLRAGQKVRIGDQA